MRSEKREEKRKLEQEAREAKRKERKRGLNRVTAFFSLVYVILAVVFSLKLYGLGMLPNLYFAIICAVLLLITILIVPSMLKGKAKVGRKIVALIVSIAMIAVFCGGIVYMNGTMDFFNKVTEEPIPTEDYYVITQADNIKENVNELEGTTVGSALMTDANYSEAKAILSKIINVEFTYDENFDVLLEKVLSKEYESALVSAAYFDTKNTEEHPEIQEGIKTLYEIEIPLEVATSTEAVDVTSEGFNIFISGTDNDGIRSDVNMIATVNPVTHRVLLTSIPRDYYVILPSKNANDKLTHATIYGIQEAVGAVEQTLGVDINYYARVNYNVVRGVVDALGGIDVNSDFDFVTHGMQELNGYHFTKGMNHLDGNQAIAFSRERKSFSAGDMQRNENQQAVLEAIIKKATSSTAVLTSYNSILSAVGDNMTTSFTLNEMSNIIKMQLETMPGWEIEKQAIKGQPAMDACFALGGAYASIVRQDPVENAKAIDEIIKVISDDGQEIIVVDPAEVEEEPTNTNFFAKIKDMMNRGEEQEE